MGSIMSKVWDDYQDYCRLCKKLGVQPWGDRDPYRNFYDHWKELREE